MPLDAGVGRVLHRPAALLHDAQAGFEIHHAGKHQRRVLAQAQPGRRRAALDQLRRVLFQLLERREAGDEQRRLAVDGRIELGRRAFGAELVAGRSPSTGAARSNSARAAGTLRTDRRAHADRLGALTGEEEGDFGRVGGHDKEARSEDDECRVTS